ncbi:QWRF motif-containing protein 7 isoform X2 [Quercus robur]|uniref:QWRF motif-containing protein 7 isoform X2 n=1 Tax=Quercus robur TaxID=38942 RepID=UPI00216155A6|nr:QWRF motif-containing protein 7 isoform X2 [Quercus robur]
METTQTRRRLSVSLPPSPPPRLPRSRSTSTTTSTTATIPATTYTLHQNISNSCTPKSSPRVLPIVKPRPKSTSKSRILFNKSEENINPSSISISSTQKKQQQENNNNNSKEGLGNKLLLQRAGSSTSPRTNNIIGATKGTRSVTNSPSAWALSPGRTLGSPVMRPESPGSSGKRVKSGGFSGVLKYFKQKKVSTLQEEEFHRFRVMHNRLLQWRFVNARAEAGMAGVKRVAEGKIFSVWIRILKLRKAILEKRIEMQKFKLEIKLHQIINPQILLLNQWAKLEKKNQESVSRVVRKLSGISVRLPLVEGAKAEEESIYQAFSTAVGVLDSIEATIAKFFSKIETVLFILTELRSTFELEDEFLEELEMAIALVSTLLAKEESVNVHLIQAAKESRRGQGH